MPRFDGTGPRGQRGLNSLTGRPRTGMRNGRGRDRGRGSRMGRGRNRR
jgi:hypothetical protein